MFSRINNILLLYFLILQNVSFANENIAEPLSLLVPFVNQQVSQDTISINGLGAIFKMRLHKWDDDTAVTVFVLKDDNPMHESFCKIILNVFPHQMRRVWDRLVFSGSGQAPIQLDTKEEMIEKLSSTVGAIGYLRLTDITDGIKVLQVLSGSGE
jgi:hypothetical protein